MALICVHGYAETGFIFNDILPHLHAPEIYNIELPGFGIEPAPKNFSITSYSDYIYQFLKDKNLYSAHFIGHSLGGYILSDFCVRYPEIVTSITFLHSHAAEDSTIRKKRRIEIANSLRKFGSEPFLNLFYEGLFKPENIKSYTQQIDQLFKNGLNIPLNTLIELQYSMRERRNLVQEISKQSFPVYFIAGKFDPLIPLEEIKKQSLQIPGSKVIESDSAHMAQFEDPKTLIAHLNSLS